MMQKIILFFLMLCCPILGSSLENLPVDQAFQLSIKKIDSQTVVAIWKIAKGYQLYKDKIKINTSAKLGKINFPEGLTKHDPDLGKYKVFVGQLTLHIPVLDKIKVLDLKIQYQGCKENAFCYPPVDKNFTITLNAETPSPWETQLPHTLIFFFFTGILLSLTPCVLPMIPILSSVVAGQKQVHMKHTVGLTTCYVLSMALSFAVAGVLTALAGHSLQAQLQKPYILVISSLLFVALAFSLFGFYEVKIPYFISKHLYKFQHQQKTGTYLGAIGLGVLSTLVVSPCVSAPLMGILIYLANAGNPWLGGGALFLMGLGMGLPLFIFGTVGGKFLPKSGPWMQVVRNLMGFTMLGVALWILSRFVAPIFIQVLMALLIAALAIYLWMGIKPITKTRIFIKTVLILMLVLFALLFLLHFAKEKKSSFSIANLHTVTTSAELNNQLEKARQQKEIAVLDFYADWCILCKENEARIFKNKNLKRLKSVYFIKVDITKQNRESQALQKSYGIFAPPAVLFYDANGLEHKKLQINGAMDSHDFFERLIKLHAHGHARGHGHEVAE